MNEFVLITPAKNEEKNIWRTIEAVVSQTVLPLEWVIVSDGSTDRTDEIVNEYCKKYSFIKLIRNESPAEKDFSSKVHAFNKGQAALMAGAYSYIGNIDADVTFEPEYFKKIVEAMEKKPTLGIAGGLIYESYDGKVRPMRTSSNSVAGAVQLFRRECFECIGGYIPIKIGGIDSAAEIFARAKGWEVKTISECKVLHHGRVLTGKKNRTYTLFQSGLGRYRLGYHPIFHLFTCCMRLLEAPVFIGSIMFLLGYISGVFRKAKRVLPVDVVSHLRQEQMNRIKSVISTVVGK
ncbi:MAG: glycosyltransferase family 2 protein [Fibrobacter sp.]|nr:glycosyltransferase family 2 protein [Fibrobacter sp.]